MRKRNIASFDQDTGEILEGILAYCEVKQDPYTTGWVMNSQEALKLLATDKELKGETYRVLLLLISQLDFENWIEVTQKEIAEMLEIKKQNVSKAVLLLEKKEIILRGPKIGRTYGFRLNPYFGWKGKVRNLEKYREEKFKNKETSDKISINKGKSSKKAKIPEFSQKVKSLSKEYDIPLEKIQDLLEGGILKVDIED